MVKMYPTKKYPGIYQEKEQLEEIEALPEITEGQVQLRKKIRNIYEKIRGSKDYTRKMAAIIRRLKGTANLSISAIEKILKSIPGAIETIRGYRKKYEPSPKEEKEKVTQRLRKGKEFVESVVRGIKNVSF